jgi:hypothetical protein
MSQPIIDDTHVDRPVPPGAAPPFGEPQQPPAAPSPADMARQSPPPPAPAAPAPAAAPGDDGDKPKGGGRKIETYEDAMAELERVRKESAERRVKLKELEPLAEKARQAEEANKTELQREREAREAAEAAARQQQEDFDRLQVAVTLGIEPDNIDLIGPGSREEMEQRALRIKAMQDAQAATPAPPPSDRPVEGLRPGASPEPPKPADDSYPESWKPNHIRDSERAQYGQ